MLYTAVKRLWHTAEKCYVEPGEVVNLDHLDSDAQQRLVKMGAVKRNEKSGRTAAADAPAAGKEG